MPWKISASTTTILRLNAELMRFFRNRVNQTADAEDLASSTWLGAGRTFERRSPLRHFLFSVAYKVLLQHRRRAIRRPAADRVDVDALQSQARTLESLMAHHALKADINRYTAQLPDAYREVVQLSLAGHDNDEIATTLQLNPNTVRSRLSRGITQLRNLLTTPPP